MHDVGVMLLAEHAATSSTPQPERSILPGHAPDMQGDRPGQAGGLEVLLRHQMRHPARVVILVDRAGLTDYFCGEAS
jgi:hypothetical protein